MSAPEPPSGELAGTELPRIDRDVDGATIEQSRAASSPTSQKRRAEDSTGRDDAGRPVSVSRSEKGEASPRRKKAKLESSDARKASSSADEGEIVEASAESSPALDDAASFGANSTQMRGVWNSAVSSGIRTSFATAPAKSLTNAPQQPMSPNSLPPPPNLPYRPQEPQTEPTSEMAEDEADPAANPPPAATQPGKGEPSSPVTTFPLSKITWITPPLQDIGDQSEDKWQSTFLLWCQQFCSSNQSNQNQITTVILVQSWKFVVARAVAKARRKAARTSAEQLASNGGLYNLLARVQSGTAKVGGAAPDEPSANDWASLLEKPSTSKQGSRGDDAKLPGHESGIPLEEAGMPRFHQLPREEEAKQLRAYFPGAAENCTLCVLCASRGHCASDCPEKICKFCSSGHHASSRCPARQRCEKCRQLGHAKSSCAEKLALAPGEGVECAFCASPNHVETGCPDIWRSYRPVDGEVQRVSQIPAYCYACGSDAHFGKDCPQNHGRHSSGRTFNLMDDVWSIAVRNMYVDPNSSALPVAWLPPLPPGLAHDGRPSIPGRSIVPQTHIYIADSEGDEDGDFLHQPIHHPPPTRQITLPGTWNARSHGPPPNGYRNGPGNQRSESWNTRRNNAPPPPGGTQQAGQGQRGRGGRATRGQPRRAQNHQNHQNSSQSNQSREGAGGQRGGGNLGRRGPRPRRGAS